MIKDKPRTFEITFRDKEKKTNVAREYETETKTEAAEIVAKITYLMANTPKDTSLF
jgi:hypothetical protein